MKYVNDRVRRQDRLMDEARALELLREGEYGVLSMVADGGGYGVPVNFVWDGVRSVYIHCAPTAPQADGHRTESEGLAVRHRQCASAAAEFHHRV